LGYDKINLAGFSYGATAAQYYLRQHEDHVRAVFLYGGSLLDIPVFERWAQNGQRAIDRIFDLCQTDPDCQAAFPDLPAQFTGMLARLDGGPVTVSFNDDANSQAATVSLTKDLLAEVIRNMTKDAKNDPRLPLLIHRAYHEGDFGEFAQFFHTNGYEWWGDQVMERVIRCGEKWAAFNPDEVARLSEGSYLKGWDVSLAQAQASSCQYTPPGEMPEGTASQTGSQVPVLVINSDLDPIDPPENMAGAKDLWPNSLSLVLPYHGHAISNYEAISCIWSIENEFIQSGSVDGLQTDCLDRIRPVDFVVPVGEILLTPTATSGAANPKPIFNTSIGELSIEEVRWVERVNGIMAGPGEKVLLVFIGKPELAKLDRSSFSLQAFDTAMRVQSNGEVHIAGNDGSYAVCAMAGWVDPDYEGFAMGFRVPATAETFQLFWPGNDPIDIHPEQ
ncbi:MAG: alpha/beta fold hydrolase, partial [Chloroflexi bacterium]